MNIAIIASINICLKFISLISSSSITLSIFLFISIFISLFSPIIIKSILVLEKHQNVYLN